MINRKAHGTVIYNFLVYMNRISNDYILKGGTSLMMCYSLDRFSEDIDLDSSNKRAIYKIVQDFCSINNFEYRVAKDTNTVKRFMIHYGGEKPLKIEVSYRANNIGLNNVTFLNGITVYNIQTIFLLKLMAFNSRDKLRDLYDVCFIYKNYKQYLDSMQIMSLREAFAYKGLGQFDFLIKDQKDDLIDNDKLASDFLMVFNDLGLL